MNKPLLISLVGVALLTLLFVGAAVNFHNTSVRLENSTKAQWQQNQNNYDKFWKTISEMAQVPDKYKEDFKDVLVGNTEARYGSDGSRAQWQWIQEHSVNFDSSMYSKIMTAIEAGRTDFEQNQKLLLDKQRKYADHIESAGGSYFRMFMSFPREVMGEVAPPSDRDGDGMLTVLDYPIVTSKRTKTAFAEAEDEALDVFGTKKEGSNGN